MARNQPGKATPEKASALLDAFQEICRQAGIKVTHQRLEIFRVLAAARDHPSTEEVYERVKRRVPTIALDTVYRTLATLERYGVLGRVQVDARARFDPNREVHHHLICKACKKIEDFSWPRFGKIALPIDEKLWGRIDSKHVEFRGICRECLKGKKPRK